MSLLGLLDYDDSSSSSSDSDEDEKEDIPSNKTRDSTKSTEENNEKLNLPSPILEASSTANSSRTFQQSSVFYNPFKAEEKKKLDVLEKHVQLSSVAPPPTKDKKRICYKFQKGKCRFGDKCRFAHSTNPTKTTATNQLADNSNEAEATSHINKQQTSYEPDNEDEDIDNKPKKRRVGVSDSLVPPKRAMKAFEKQKQKQIPWNS